MKLPWQKKQDIGRAVSRCLSGPLPTQRNPRQDQSSLSMGQRLGTTAMEDPSHLILIQSALSHSPVDFDGVGILDRNNNNKSLSSYTSVPINRKELIYNFPLLAGQHDSIYS